MPRPYSLAACRTNCISSYTPCLDTRPDCIYHTSPAFLLAEVCSHPTAPTLAQGTSVLIPSPLPGMLGHSVSHYAPPSGCWDPLPPSHIHCLDARTWTAAYGWTSSALHKGSQPRGYEPWLKFNLCSTH